MITTLLLATVAHWAVPPMSNVMRLGDTEPWDGEKGAPVRIIAAKGEYEPGSFLLRSDTDLEQVQLVVGELRNEKGQVFPKDRLDLTVVKIWYQNGNAWYSYFGDTGMKPCPELLLHDENLIRTDAKTKSNYAKLREKDGTVREMWINPPRRLDKRLTDLSYRGGNSFQPMKENFYDAETIQPVSLVRNEYKQFFLTAHVTKEIPAGVYRGNVELRVKNEESVGTVPVELKVCDFELPAPRAYNHPEQEFYVSSYAYISHAYVMEQNGGNLDLAKRQLQFIFDDMAAHNQDMYIIQWGNDRSRNKLDILEMMQKAGMRTDVLMGFVSPERNGAVSDEALAEQAEGIRERLDRLLGHHNVYMTFGDEPGWRWLYPSRRVFRPFQERGLKFYIAGSASVFHKDGYLYDWHNFAAESSGVKPDGLIRNWNPQPETRVGWYANHHVGTENPSFNRRQNGLGCWLTGYSALCNYAHHLGPYNDDSTGYKPMVFAYGTGRGMIDTLQWEGFREGVDDIRYGTLLLNLAREAKKSSDLDVRYLGGKALTFVGECLPEETDMDHFRREAVRFIEELLAKGVKPAAMPSLKPAKKITEAAKDAYLAGEDRDEKKKLWHCFAYGNFDFTTAAPIAGKLLAAKDWKGHGREVCLALLATKPELVKDRLDEILIFNANTNFCVSALANCLHGERRNFIYQEKFDTWKLIYRWVRGHAADAKWKPSFEVGRNAAYAAIRTGDAAFLKDAVAHTLAEAKKLKPEEAYELKLYLAVHDAVARLGQSGPQDRGGDCPSRPALRRGAVKDAAAKVDAAGLEPKVREKAIGAVASLFNEICDEDAVRGLDDLRRTLYGRQEKKVYMVRFSDTPVGLWKNLAFEPEKSKFDRKYGTSAQFLATDVTTGTRVQAKEGEKLDEVPYMEVLADEFGLHFRYTVTDPKAKEVEFDRSLGMSFEGYVAPGADEPYECITIEPGNDHALDCIYNTTYDTFGHRRIHPEDQGRYTLVTEYNENTIVSMLSFSWENFAERLPVDGGTYDYEQMCWSRAGNFCWNGTESIHGRSTWGLLRFELTDAQRAKILRRVLATNKIFYQHEKQVCGPGYEGALGHWYDSQTGDPLFYATEVVPLVEKGDRWCDELVPAADYRTLRRLELEALPLWRNVRLEVARRRADYLARKLCDAAPKTEELFNGRDLAGWYVKLNGQPKGSDTNGCFTVKDGSILVSGQDVGYLATEKEYGDYRLTLDYRFVGKGWYHREHTAADSGLLFHGFGKDGAVDGGSWMASYEYNIIVGRTGDLIVVGDDNVKESMDCRCQIDSKRRWDPRNGTVKTIGKFQNAKNYWAVHDVKGDDKRPAVWPEKKYGEWNRVELVCRGSTATFLLNGEVVNTVTDLPVTKGKILLQTELHGVEFRNVTLTKIP